MPVVSPEFGKREKDNRVYKPATGTETAAFGTPGGIDRLEKAVKRVKKLQKVGDQLPTTPDRQ